MDDIGDSAELLGAQIVRLLLVADDVGRLRQVVGARVVCGRVELRQRHLHNVLLLMLRLDVHEDVASIALRRRRGSILAVQLASCR